MTVGRLCYALSKTAAKKASRPCANGYVRRWPLVDRRRDGGRQREIAGGDGAEAGVIGQKRRRDRFVLLGLAGAGGVDEASAGPDAGGGMGEHPAAADRRSGRGRRPSAATGSPARGGSSPARSRAHRRGRGRTRRGRAAARSGRAARCAPAASGRRPRPCPSAAGSGGGADRSRRRSPLAPTAAASATVLPPGDAHASSTRSGARSRPGWQRAGPPARPRRRAATLHPA